MAVSIRPTTYRDRPGFLICGRPDPSSHIRVRIFTVTRASAEHIRAKVRAGAEIVTADFAVTTAP